MLDGAKMMADAKKKMLDDLHQEGHDQGRQGFQKARSMMKDGERMMKNGEMMMLQVGFFLTTCTVMNAQSESPSMDCLIGDERSGDPIMKRCLILLFAAVLFSTMAFAAGPTSTSGRAPS